MNFRHFSAVHSGLETCIYCMGFSTMICIFMVIFNESPQSGLQVSSFQSSEDLPMSTFLAQQMIWDLNRVVFGIHVQANLYPVAPWIVSFYWHHLLLAPQPICFHFKSCPLCSAFWPCKLISCIVCNKYFPEIWMNYVNDFSFINSAVLWNDPNTFVIHDPLLAEPGSFPFTKSHS